MRIDFNGFAGDCLITGSLQLDGERLTDHLNAHPVLELEDVVLEGLDGGRVTAARFEIERSQLCAALATGPRGATILRVPTDERRLQAQIGPYMVLGRFHGPVGATSLQSFSERDPMVPLTDATIAYVIHGILEVRDAAVIIVNRELAAWYREASESEAVGVPGAAAARGPLRRIAPRRAPAPSGAEPATAPGR